LKDALQLFPDLHEQFIAIYTKETSSVSCLDTTVINKLPKLSTILEQTVTPVDFIFVEVAANLQMERGSTTFSYPEPVLHAVKKA
jgi:hypothetical protein